MKTPPPHLTPYQRDLLDQPRALRATLAGLRGQSFPTHLLPAAGQSIVLTGMGASHSVFYPLHQALVRRGFAAQMVETSELLYTLEALLRPGQLVIAASQSGRSVEVRALAERKAAGGAFTLIGVTNTHDSPLATRPDAAVLTNAGVETAVSTKTYLAITTALAWLEAGLLGEDPSARLDEIESTLPALEAYIANWQSHVSQLIQPLTGARDLFYTGRGRSLAAAHTAGLITKESTHLHGEGMSTPAFRHGPLEMVSPSTFVLVYEGTGADVPLNRRLYDDVLKAGGQAALVSNSNSMPVFRLPAHLPESARPIFEILPVQMMTLALSALHGHEAGKFDRLTKVTAIE